MNKMILVCVLDKKAEAFHPPYSVQNVNIACRAFGDAVRKGGSDLSNHPEDFCLFKVGEIDLETGNLSPVSPVQICSGLDYVMKDAANEN